MRIVSLATATDFHYDVRKAMSTAVYLWALRLGALSVPDNVSVLLMAKRILSIV